MEHGTYDEFWKARNILPHLKNIRPAVLTVGGWYDANNYYGALHVFRPSKGRVPGTDNALVIGPWSHGQWASATGSKLGGSTSDRKTGGIPRDDAAAVLRLPPQGRSEAPPCPRRSSSRPAPTGGRHTTAGRPHRRAARAIYLGAGGALSFELPELGTRQTRPTST